jgi:hypothetical protein
LLEIKSESSPKHPTQTEPSLKSLPEKTRHSILINLYERSYRVVLKNMHYSINPAEIQSEIEKLGHTVTSIYNIKHHLTKLPLTMFFVDLKLAINNKDIFNVECLQ